MAKTNHVGETYGLWTIVGVSSQRYPNGKILYDCECSKCGCISTLTLDNIKRSKGRGCRNCIPDYHFQDCGAFAIGYLPNGTAFTIDKEDVEKISSLRWFYNSGSGYINSTPSKKGRQFKLHRFVLGLERGDGRVVDHINRNKCDCRKGNLRIVTVAQNTLNKTKRFSNKSGYVGVSWVMDSHTYKASIQIAHHGFTIGKSKDPIVCAQMYNIAAQLLFGEYCGQLNDTPKPNNELIEYVKTQCKPYFLFAEAVSFPSKERCLA